MNRFYPLFVFLILGLGSSASLLAQLSPGDIMIVGFVGDGDGLAIDGLNCQDGFAFAALVDIPANTTIFFTEEEYFDGTFGDSEGDISWTPNEVVPAGSIIRITTHAQNSDCGSLEATLGDVEFPEDSPGNWALSTANEEIYAYLGSLRNPTTWLTGFFSDLSAANNQVPSELSGFIVDFTNVNSDVDLAILSNEVDCGNKVDCLAFITNLDNWGAENTGNAGDCCNGTGIEYPRDLPLSLSSCEAPVINGITVINCPSSPNGLFNLAIDGSLNGAAFWDWSGLIEEGQDCEDLSTGLLRSGNGEISISFFFPEREFVVRAVGGCITDTICFSFVPAELLNTATFTLDAASYCINSGTQTGLSGGSPEGGTYSGPGIMDDGNGMTYTFNPELAGAGNHIITYSLGSECSIDAEVAITVANVKGGNIILSNGEPATTICIGDESSDTLAFTSNGNVEASFIYIITDTNNIIQGQFETGTFDFGLLPSDVYRVWGMSYTGNLIAELGDDASSERLSDDCYDLSDNFVTVSVNVVPQVTFESPGPFNVDTGLQPLTGGLPIGGVYSGPGVTNTIFDPAAVGPGIYTITYTFTDTTGCVAAASEEVLVLEAPAPANDTCSGAADLNALFGQPVGETQISETYNFSDYHAENGDSLSGLDCFKENIFNDTLLQSTAWFTFTGDGSTYRIKTIACGNPDSLSLGDTQMAIYTGNCGHLVPVACNEDENDLEFLFNAFIEFTTSVDSQYTILIDRSIDEVGGDFCIEVTQIMTTSVINTSTTTIQLYPNPAKDLMNIDQVDAQSIHIYNKAGQLIQEILQPGSSFDVSDLARGFYIMKIQADNRIYFAKVIKQ